MKEKSSTISIKTTITSLLSVKHSRTGNISGPGLTENQMEERKILTGGIGLTGMKYMIRNYSGVDEVVDSNIANLMEKNIHIGDILSLFTVEESVKIAYMPIVLMEIAMQYIDAMINLCVSKRLESTKKEVRMFKKLKEEYKVYPFENMEEDVLDMAKKSMNDFFRANSRDTTTLYYTVSNALLKGGMRDYIGMDETKHDILVYAVCAISIMDYIRKIDESCTAIITQRVKSIGGSYKGIVGESSRFIPYLSAFTILSYGIISNVYKNENLKEKDLKDDFVRRMVRIIALKVDTLMDPIIEEKKKLNEVTKVYKE